MNNNTSNVTSNNNMKCLECPSDISYLDESGHCISIFSFDSFAKSVTFVDNKYNLTCVDGYFVKSSNELWCVPCSQIDMNCLMCSNLTGTPMIEKCMSGYFLNPDTNKCESCNIPNCVECVSKDNKLIVSRCMDGFFTDTN